MQHGGRPLAVADPPPPRHRVLGPDTRGDSDTAAPAAAAAAGNDVHDAGRRVQRRAGRVRRQLLQGVGGVDVVVGLEARQQEREGACHGADDGDDGDDAEGRERREGGVAFVAEPQVGSRRVEGEVVGYDVGQCGLVLEVQERGLICRRSIVVAIWW